MCLIDYNTEYNTDLSLSLYIYIYVYVYVYIYIHIHTHDAMTNSNVVTSHIIQYCIHQYVYSNIAQQVCNRLWVASVSVYLCFRLSLGV